MNCLFTECYIVILDPTLTLKATNTMHINPPYDHFV